MTKELLHSQLEQAATALLTDEEIIESLGIDQDTLDNNYVHVSRARLKLKQSLNVQRINEAEQSGNAADILNNIPRNRIQYKGEGHGSYTNPNPARGGARPGSGRRPGTPNKITGASILRAIELKTGDTFENLLAQGYYESIQNNDKNTRLTYEKLFLSKVVSDRVDVSLDAVSDEQLRARVAALHLKSNEDTAD